MPDKANFHRTCQLVVIRPYVPHIRLANGNQRAEQRRTRAYHFPLSTAPSWVAGNRPEPEMPCWKPRIEAAVAALPGDEFFYVLTEMGWPEALPVLALGTPEQVQTVMDMGIWDRDQVDDQKMGAWLEAMVEAARRLGPGPSASTQSFSPDDSSQRAHLQPGFG